MAKPKLFLARPPRKPSFSLLRRALMLYRGEGIPRELAKSNAIKWLRAMRELGDRHILKGARVTWGTPGDGRSVGQVYAPRVSGERT
jgi:TPR repeat protein